MRLIGAVKKLEGAAAAALADSGAGFGIAWTKQVAVVDAMSLAEGEYIAIDLVFTAGPEGAPGYWEVAERVTLDVSDLGVFYELPHAGGGRVRVGEVVAIDTDMIRYKLDADPAWNAPERRFLRAGQREWDG